MFFYLNQSLSRSGNTMTAFKRVFKETGKVFVGLRHNCSCFSVFSHQKIRTHSGMASQLFQGKDIANVYSSFRPVYPLELKNKILEYMKRNTDSEYDLVVDIGCGSGQSTLMWSDVFRRVIGTDISKAQIDKAPNYVENITFEVGTAHEIRVEDNAVDLVTIAQAMHWVDTTIFYREVKRVLKPKGVLAVCGYGNLALDKSEANDIVSKEFYETKLHGGKFWEPGRKHIDNLYSDFTPLPFSDFERIDTLKMEKCWSLDHFLGYVSSWSGYRAYLEKYPDSKVLDELRERLQSVYGEESLRVTWPVFILLGRK